jgi:lipoprotein-anchoring transpeptidase ErfK/SrfK
MYAERRSDHLQDRLARGRRYKIRVAMDRRRLRAGCSPSTSVRQPAGSVLGPFALQLTAHSNTLKNYGGRPGRVAMHGRSGGLLADPLGSARSHGCIRMQNRIIRWLARRALPGTPVEVW